MDWLKTVLPTVATALGGPLAGVAVNFIADKLGLEDKTVEAVQAAISGASPEQLVQLKQIDADLQKYFAGLGIKLEEIAAADRASARDREIKTGDSLSPRILAVVFIVGWFAIQSYLLGHVVPQEMREIIMRTLGTMDMALGLILGYYFGSSAGSAEKSALLARKA